MSRSYKKTPICGHGGKSEKKDKRINNRMFRRCERQRIQTEEYDKLPIDMNEVRNIWDMAKDGKSWYGWMAYEDFRWFSRKENELIIEKQYWKKTYTKLMRK